LKKAGRRKHDVDLTYNVSFLKRQAELELNMSSIPKELMSGRKHHLSHRRDEISFHMGKGGESLSMEESSLDSEISHSNKIMKNLSIDKRIMLAHKQA
jgi:hypothetical protein